MAVQQRRQPGSASIGRLLAVVWPFLVIVVVLVVISSYRSRVLAGARAYAAGNAMWSAAQKDAVTWLHRYAETGVEEHWQAYQREIAVPINDRCARLQLARAKPDYARVRSCLRAGRNAADDIDDLIAFFRKYGNSPGVRDAVVSWQQGDRLILALDAAARQLHQAVRNGDRRDSARILELLVEIDDHDARLAPIERRFMTQISTGSRHLQRRLGWIGFTTALLLTLVGLILSARAVRQQMRVENALHESEQRQRLSARVFEAASEGMLITDAGNRIVSANRAFVQMSGYDSSALAGRHVFRLCAPGTDHALIEQVQGDLEAEGQWRGEVAMRTAAGEQQPLDMSVVEVRDDQARITHRIYVCRDIAELKYAQARIRHLAYFDSLTGLPNRSYLATHFDELLAEARRRDRPLAVVFFDLDGFKEINDTLGHSAGDMMIRAIARRLAANIRAGDILCRFGGDEFLLLLPDRTHEQVMQQVGDLLQQVNMPLQIDGRTVSTTISAGFSLYPEDADDAEGLVRDADMALYRAKERGKNIIERYRTWMSSEVSWRHDMLAALRKALAEEQFELRFQPVIALAEHRVCGVEALLYWNHPGLGRISPGSFIPLAEQSGLIESLGSWLMGEALRIFAGWRQAQLPRFYLAINVSGYQLRHARILQDQLLDAAQQHSVELRDIVLEITERQIVYDLSASLPVLEQLADRGVGLSIDDFGTGYSSLEYLKDMPVSQVKIDRTFVHKLPTEAGDRAIVSAIIGLGRSLGLQVVAEGVETHAQLHLLQRMGCNAVQGYYFATPLAADELPGFIRELSNTRTAADFSNTAPAP